MICVRCEIDKKLNYQNFRPNRTKRGFRLDCRSCEAEAARIRWHKDPEHGRAILRKYVANLSDEKREIRHSKTKEWQRENYEQHRVHKNRAGRKRRSMQFGAFVEDVDPLIRLELDDGVCGICGKDVDPLSFHVDHIIPLIHGGEHGYANTQVAHPSCNVRKGAQCEW